MTNQVRQHRARPVNLNLFRFHFPLAAVTSITHRITGVALFLGMWVLLYFLHLGLEDDGSGGLSAVLGSFSGKGVLALLAACATFHLAAGFKHLLMDLHIGETLDASRMLSWSTWLLTLLLTGLVVLALWW